MGAASTGIQFVDRVFRKARSVYDREIVMRCNAARGLLAVDIRSSVGFFAHLSWMLGMLNYADRKGLTPVIRLSSPQYADRSGTPDWFPDYFEPFPLDSAQREAVRSGVVRFIRVETASQGIALTRDVPFEERYELSTSLIARYLRPAPAIREAVEQFAASRLKPGTVLGVHYRGTDKRVEADRLTYEQMAEATRSFLSSRPHLAVVFVSSDEVGFPTFLRDYLPQVEVIWHEDVCRTKGKAIHNVIDGRGRIKGEEALVNCLLLARCAALVKSASLLSAWSKLWNPAMETLLVNVPRPEALWFPENRILEEMKARGDAPTLSA